MNKLTSTIKTSASVAKLKLKEASPDILVAAGIISGVATVVMACRATLKAQPVIEEMQVRLEGVKEGLENKELFPDYTELQARSDKRLIYFQSGVKLLKVYAPTIALGTFSLTSILVSHMTLRKRNIALASAYATVAESFRQYRNRVKEQVGEEIERDIRLNTKVEEIEKTSTDEKGEEVKTVEQLKIPQIGKHSAFAKIFDESNTNWKKDARENEMFLRLQQNFANEKLQLNGYLFLNDVYAMLGIDPTEAGRVVGWVYRPDDPDHNGDNYVDFGMYHYEDPRKRAFINGDERSIVLDFNVDGDLVSSHKLGWARH